MLRAQTYKNSYYWYLPKMIKIFTLLNKFKIQLKQKGEWLSESPQRKLEQLWVEHDDQPVPEKAKQIHDFPMAGVSLREGGRPYPHPSHSKWTLRSLAYKRIELHQFGSSCFWEDFAPEAATPFLMFPHTLPIMRTGRERPGNPCIPSGISLFG